MKRNNSLDAAAQRCFPNISGKMPEGAALLEHLWNTAVCFYLSRS